MKYGDYKKRQINDIVVKGHMNGFDVRQPHVRHQSIGYLDDEYLGRRHLASGARNLGITYVPPLKNLSLNKDYRRRARAAFKNGLVKSRMASGSAISAMGASLATISTPLTSRLPKRYTAYHGLQTDYSAPVFAYLKLMVLAVLLLVGTVVLFPGKESPQTPLTVTGGGNQAHTTGESKSGQNSSNHQRNSNSASNSQATTRSGGGGASGATGAGGSSTTARPSGTATTGTSGGTSAAPATGGMGGGSGTIAPSGSGSTTPTGSSGGGSGSILPTVSVPLNICTKPPLPSTCVN